MRFLQRLITISFALFLIVLSVMNRHLVSVFWMPGKDALHLPLYFVFFAGIFLGLFAAAYVTNWIRFKAFFHGRKMEKRAAALQQECDTLKEDVTKLKAKEGLHTQMHGTPASTTLVNLD